VNNLMQHTYTWSTWEKAKWCSAFLLSGLALGAITIAIADWFLR